MKHWGIGPLFILFSGIYAAIGVWLTQRYEPALTLNVLPEMLCTLAGGILIVAGIALYSIAAFQLHYGHRQGSLLTSGLYGRVRHPIYAAFILLIAPGAAIMSRSLLLFALPFVMYGIFSALIENEESLLESYFGQDYHDYAEDIPRIFPRL